MRSFHHINVFTMEEAVKTLQDYQGRAAIIAGGTDLLGVLKDDLLPGYPEALINVKAIPGLDYIREDSTGVQIGSLVKLSKLIGSPLIREKYPLLSAAARSVATPQIRNMATIGGNLAQDTRCWYYRYPHSVGGRILCLRKGKGPCLAVNGDNRYHAVMGGKGCFAVCPSDTAVALLALNADLKTLGAEGARTIPLSDFYTPLGHILEQDELIREIRLPAPPENSRQQFIKYTLREPVDFAVVSVAVLLTLENGVCQDVRIVLGAMAPMPLRAESAEKALTGRKLDLVRIEEAAELAVKGAKPLSMNAYKVEIARTLVKRALMGAVN